MLQSAIFTTPHIREISVARRIAAVWTSGISYPRFVNEAVPFCRMECFVFFMMPRSNTREFC